VFSAISSCYLFSSLRYRFDSIRSAVQRTQATEERSESARLSSFVGALAIGDVVKTTLGPKGMNKILQSSSTGEIQITNDGATILKSIQLDNPAAKILVNISKVSIFDTFTIRLRTTVYLVTVLTNLDRPGARR